jgi:Domain of unknown function (DUF1741)
MCIVHNDTLLDDDKSYVSLLYEIVRVKPTFEALAQICKYRITVRNSLVLRLTHQYWSASPKLGDPARKGSATSPQRGGMDLFNIEHIISHFDEKIELWKSKNKIRTLKPQNVIGKYNLNPWQRGEERTLKVADISIDAIYEYHDKLELRPAERLEQFSSYSEVPREMAFFRNILRIAAIDAICEVNIQADD